MQYFFQNFKSRHLPLEKNSFSSVVTDNSALVGGCMDDVVAGTYGNKTIYGDLSNGCLSVGTFSNLVSEEVQAEYLDYVEQIKEGTFVK